MTESTRPGFDPSTETTITPTGSPEADGIVTPIATTPVGGRPAEPGSAGPRRSRARWFAAAGIVGLVIAASAAAALLLTGAAPASSVVGYVPADSTVYGEVRLDLPGDQRQELGEFLSKFPGFADQAALETKVDEVLDRLVGDASGGEQTYSADIKPWFGGELGFVVGPIPTGSASSEPMQLAADGRGLLLISITDEALARAWFEDVLGKTGATATSESYDGVDLTIYAGGDGAGHQGAFGIVAGKVALVGDPASVKAAIDTKGGSGLAKAPAYTTATTAMDGDHIGFLFVDLQALMAGVMDIAGSAGQEIPLSGTLLDRIPDWTAARLRVEGDAVVMDSVYPHVDAPGAASGGRANGVPAWAPPSTVLLVAGNDFGSALQAGLESYGDTPGAADSLAELEQLAGILGGADAILGWMGDAGLVVSRDGTTLEGGIVIVPTDPAAASQLLTTIRTFVALGGGQGLTVREEDHAGTTITILDLGTAESLLGLAGTMGGAALPVDPSAIAGLPAGNIELSFATTDGVVVIGSGPDFVRSVLDAGAGESLADQTRFGALLDRAGTSQASLNYVDLAAVRDLVDGLMADVPAADRAEYEESIKPYLAPLDAMLSTGTVGTELDGQHVVVTVK